MRASAGSYVISPAALTALQPDPARWTDHRSAVWLLALGARLGPRAGGGLDMPHPFRIEPSVESEATPEEVGEALPIGDQLGGWGMGAPNEVEPGLAGAVRQSFGGEVSESTIPAWAPPHRFADE